jgi:hypothetical protein
MFHYDHSRRLHFLRPPVENVSDIAGRSELVASL